MSLTLSKGYKKPQTGDSGTTFFPDLEFDIQRLNDHSHDGANSEKLSVISSKSMLQSNAGAAWVLVGGTDYYRKVITIPSVLVSGGYLLTEVNYQIRDSATGEILSLSNAKVSNTSFEVYSTDNSLSIDVVYTT